MQEQPERQAIRQFLDFMRIGDRESAYQAVEKMKFGDFVDALEAVQRERNGPSNRNHGASTTAHPRAVSAAGQLHDEPSGTRVSGGICRRGNSTTLLSAASIASRRV